LSGVPETLLIDKQGKIVLFTDPENGEPTVKIDGPREWDSNAMHQQIEKLLAN
jgi:hypothetical protein